MTIAKRYISSLIVTVSLVAPAAIIAKAAAQEANAQVRVYDKDHKDYHNWDDNENHYWEQYQTEHHMKAHEFSKANKKEQSEYWNWRHEHPDGK
jgi:aspartate carbamoyltransferase catalytic subunit